MVADLVDQHMPHNDLKRFVVLGPVIEDRAAVKPDHVGERAACCSDWNGRPIP